jgi:two-component sensor histidine kinase
VVARGRQAACGPLDRSGRSASQPPTRKGFGTRMMQSMIDGVKGRVQLDWRAQDLACEIAIPT